MNIQLLQNQFQQCFSLSLLDAFLAENLHNIRPIFYGFTNSELDECRFDYENAFYVLTNSQSGQELRNGTQPSGSVQALLVFFFSFFERAQLYAPVLEIANMFPIGSLHYRAKAIFEYRNITNVRTDYLNRFDTVVKLIQKSLNQATSKGLYAQCEDILIEFFCEALQKSWKINYNIRNALMDLYRYHKNQVCYPILKSPRIERIFAISDDAIVKEALTTRSRIVEYFHAEACSLVPEVLLHQEMLYVEDYQKHDQRFKDIPEYIDTILGELNASYRQTTQEVQLGLDADDTRNRFYLGTYFPRSLIESRNILNEVFSVPVVAEAFRQKDVIRLLDIGSGTGGSTVGAILALVDAFKKNIVIEVTSVDGNMDALDKQKSILQSLNSQSSIPLMPSFIVRTFPTALDDFSKDFEDFASRERPMYDIILFWKHLSEYYNHNFAQAQGIVQRALKISSRLLVPNSLCFMLDVTTKDNGFEYFPISLNREANAYEEIRTASMRTIIPIPCAFHAKNCKTANCFTQRIFEVNHRLRRSDISKVSYRVFAPVDFAANIVNTFTPQESFRVNAQRKNKSCRGGSICVEDGAVPSGFTGFFRCTK